MYQQATKSPFFKHMDFTILDIVVLQISYVVSYWLRFGFGNPYGETEYIYLVVAATIVDLLVIMGADTLQNVLSRSYLDEFEKCLQHFFYFIVIITAVLFFAQGDAEFSRMLVLFMGLISMGLHFVAHLFLKKMIKSFRRKRGGKKTLLFATENQVQDALTNLIENAPNVNVAGIVILDQDKRGEKIQGFPVVAAKENAAAYVCQNWVDEVYVQCPLSKDYPYELLNNLVLMGVTIHQEMQGSSEVKGRIKFWEKIGDQQVLTTVLGSMTAGQAVMKRLIDILGGLAGCILTGIIYLIIAPKIKKESPGPVFFSQTRIGANGKPFRMYKFRSMYLDAEERKKELMAQNRVKDGMMFKLDFDPRIIGCKQLPDGTIQKGIGNKIRDWSIDEFPQFWNVLKGEMSLVGTRPPTLDEWEKYEYHHRARMATKPGITGMWQTSGRSNITDFEEVVRLDTEYITGWNFKMDILLIVKTVLVALKKEGSM